MHDADAVDALTAQVNELARICARLSRENGELRSEIAALSAVDALAPLPAVAAPGSRTRLAELGVSRRTVGVALAGAAAGVVGATVLGDRGGARAATTADIGHDERTAAGRAAAGGTATAESEHARRAAASSAPDEETAAAAPTSSGSIINGTLSTASGVLSGDRKSVV